MADDTWGWRIEPCRDGRNFLITRRYAHSFEIKAGRHRLPEVEKALAKHVGRYRVAVPAGFKFDGSSTPRIVWSLAPPMTGRHTHASLLHDWLYVEKKLVRNGAQIDCTRDLADLIFLEVMKQDGVKRDLRETMYGAVRNHGRHAWRT